MPASAGRSAANVHQRGMRHDRAAASHQPFATKARLSHQRRDTRRCRARHDAAAQKIRPARSASRSPAPASSRLTATSVTSTSRRGEMAETGKSSGRFGFTSASTSANHRALMMIDDDHGHPEPPRFRQRLEAGGAAMNRPKQPGAFFPPSMRIASTLVRSLRRCGRIWISGSTRNGSWCQPASAARWRRDFVIAKIATFHRASPASAMRFAALPLSDGVGSGISLRMVGSRKSSTASIADVTPGQHPPSISQ